MKINGYSIRMLGGAGLPGGVLARIYLFNESGTMQGSISFLDQGQALPADEEKPSLHMHMHISMMASVIDMLRNEGPVYMHWQKSLKMIYLGTSMEPVGEGE